MEPDDERLIAERDTAQEWADELADLMATITGTDIAIEAHHGCQCLETRVSAV